MQVQARHHNMAAMKCTRCQDSWKSDSVPLTVLLPDTHQKCSILIGSKKIHLKSWHCNHMPRQLNVSRIITTPLIVIKSQTKTIIMNWSCMVSYSLHFKEDTFAMLHKLWLLNLLHKIISQHRKPEKAKQTTNMLGWYPHWAIPCPDKHNSRQDQKKNNNMKSLFNRFRRQYKSKSCNYTPEWLPPTE